MAVGSARYLPHIPIALFIGKCCSKDDTVVPAGEITETAIIVDEAGEGALTGANSVAGQNAGTDASSVNSSTGAAVSDATGATTAKATGNTGTCTTAPAEAVAQIEKYQKQFDAIEYPVGEYQLKPEAKAILDNVGPDNERESRHEDYGQRICLSRRQSTGQPGTFR